MGGTAYVDLLGTSFAPPNVKPIVLCLIGSACIWVWTVVEHCEAPGTSYVGFVRVVSYFQTASLGYNRHV